MGKKGKRDRQARMWDATADLPKSAGHPFYARLNRVLDDAGFDTFVDAQCAQFYADGIGRPSLAPGRYFRWLLLGYFERFDSERAIAWRAADSLNIRHVPGLCDARGAAGPFDPVAHAPADRRRDAPSGVHVGVAAAGGRPPGGGAHDWDDATTLEANAAMPSIVRRDTGEAYEAWLTWLAEASGNATPTRAELARFDRKRKKKGSNEDWTHPHDPDAKITKMKDGRTHLAHTAAHAVDLETGAILGLTRAGRMTLAPPRRCSRRHDRSGGSRRRGGRRFGNRRGRGRQAVSQQRDDGWVCGSRRPELCVGA